MGFWNKDNQAESKSAVDEIVADRRNRVADLVAEVEHLLEHARVLIAADGDVGSRYAAHVVGPWRDDITAAFQAFRDEVVGNLPALREAVRLTRSGDARIAAAKFGPLLARIRALEARLGELKRQRPHGLSRVGLHETMRVRPAPSLPAQRLLEILFEGAPQSDFGLLTTDDVVSRLKIEEQATGIAPQDFIIHLGTRVVYVWNHDAIVAELEKHPVEATASA